MADFDYEAIHRNDENQPVIAVCDQIWQNSRNELYLHMHFLDLALSSLQLVPDESAAWVWTDGSRIGYHPGSLMGIFARGRVRVNRVYLHLLLHCLFLHMDTRKGRDTKNWNLACDIAVEYQLDHMQKRCLHIPLSPFRRSFYLLLDQRVRVANAQAVWQFLKTEPLPLDWSLRLEQEFAVDDHSCWEQQQQSSRQRERQKNWEHIRERMQTEIETYGRERGESSDALTEQLRLENRETYDYREFLRKFMVWKEELIPDPDTFDYIYYTYGMELYGNVPLMEPLETSEVHKIEDFVIAIDTSMSCSGELVRRFLEQTYEILCESESFFRKIHLRILQCDDRIEQDVRITNEEEFRNYLEQLTIKGYGGTDFRPVFTYVNQLTAQGVFHKLRGLLYFTDGFGTFPVRMPVYETAFVFLEGNYCDVDVPPWAIKLVVRPDQLIAEQYGE